MVEKTEGQTAEHTANQAVSQISNQALLNGNVALFLASGLSDFITGENILVTGGDLMV